MALNICTLRIKASLRAQVAEDKLNVPLRRDEAPNQQILRQIIRVNLHPALKLRSTMLTHDVLVQQRGAVVCSIISSCVDSVMSYWMNLESIDSESDSPYGRHWQHTCTWSIWRSPPSVVPTTVRMVVRKKISRSSLTPVLNFTVLEQQHIIKPERFLQLPCENI